NTLPEILTIKSDDVAGRSKAYESIIKDEPISKLAIPESFNILVRELKGLGLDVELMKGKRERVIKEVKEEKPKVEPKKETKKETKKKDK
ncbi:hypothetical protein HOE31_01765, partial [bacterium]|nr:hypothetical protein [bacterium]